MIVCLAQQISFSTVSNFFQTNGVISTFPTSVKAGKYFREICRRMSSKFNSLFCSKIYKFKLKHL